MPNTYIKPEERVALALALLHQRSRRIGLVTLYDGRNFIGSRNDTLIYETKGITKARDYEFRTRNAPIVWDEIYKTSLAIKIDQHMTQGVKFTDEEELFDLTSYGREILLPQVEAIAERFDSKIDAKISGYANFATNALALNASADTEGKQALRFALQIKAKADADGVPAQGRQLVAGANVYAYFVASGAVVAYDQSQATTAFRQGVFGTIAGFEVVDGTGLVADDEFVLLHKSWMVLANAAPVVPAGATWGARQTYQGISLRVIRDYDPNYASDRSLVNTFYGFSAIEDEFDRHTTSSAAAAGGGTEAGDVIIEDGEPVLTGKNVRGLRGSLDTTP